ncbi:hypothetical protein T265_11155 [Opisthorchis viverrini]|uniref:Uncharacterized protein n=1 Tax=Opisthorchis viverrini TaxID=6198 RepID=A0A074ZYL1_OPIVI|nr:hypothetical protein T265_11155 [Opisthorchis viverrini]KER20249.1 hypothetical protein T265_11155 [Opisthorchis viverrini]
MDQKRGLNIENCQCLAISASKVLVGFGGQLLPHDMLHWLVNVLHTPKDRLPRRAHLVQPFAQWKRPRGERCMAWQRSLNTLTGKHSRVDNCRLSEWEPETQLPGISRLCQPGSNLALVLPPFGVAARYRKGVTAERFILFHLNLVVSSAIITLGFNLIWPSRALNGARASKLLPSMHLFFSDPPLDSPLTVLDLCTNLSAPACNAHCPPLLQLTMMMNGWRSMKNWFCVVWGEMAQVVGARIY